MTGLRITGYQGDFTLGYSSEQSEAVIMHLTESGLTEKVSSAVSVRVVSPLYHWNIRNKKPISPTAQSAEVHAISGAENWSTESYK